MAKKKPRNNKPGNNKPSNNKPKLGKGKKLCCCKKVVGARTQKCPHCSHVFQYVKVKDIRKKRLIKVNWKDLKRGDRIRVYKTGASYFENDRGAMCDLHRNGEYVVKSLTKDGIKCFDDKGFTFVYMGRPKQNRAGFFSEPHQIRKVEDN